MSRPEYSSSDNGFTLLEVIVAMFVLMIIMTGFVYTITSTLTLTRDTRTRVVAANLASQQIDLVRANATVFDVTNSTHDTTLNGDTFHITVKTAWVTSSGDSATCDAGVTTGSLAYKQVNVSVTWDNMRQGAQPVYSDTVINPATKINDPTLGTILVGVINSAGTGVSGATASLSPASGVASVTTDSDGCAYLLKVPPGDYTVSVAKSGYVSSSQVASPSAVANVKAGTSSRVSFSLDRETTFTTQYATNFAGSVSIPNNLTTTFVSTYGNYQLAPTPNSSTKTKSFKLFPISSGYSVLAGAYAETPDNPSTSCLAPDPGQWTAGIRDGDAVIGTRPTPVAGAPGDTVIANVPMGIVKLSNANGSGKYLKAVYVGGGSGDPGCPAKMTYVFDDVISSNNATVALPYGTWQLYRGSTSGTQTSPVTSGISVLTEGSESSGIVTLDPREKE